MQSEQKPNVMETLTKEQIKTTLTKKGVGFKSKMTKAELLSILARAKDEEVKARVGQAYDGEN